jgi:catechol 2,3-dioxygenase-like lactoylglutathione lyase family enzyme
MTVWKVDHFAFQVGDLDAAIAFYAGKLGMKLLFRETDIEHGEAFAFFELDGGNLELLQTLDASHSRGPRAIAPPYCPHLALTTPDMDATIAMLRDQAITIAKGPFEIPGKVRWLYAVDPDNNIIEFVQWV